MHPISNILCPIDFSDFSLRALDLAIGLGQDFSARVAVLYVADLREFSPAWALRAPEMAAENRKRVEEQMMALVEEKGLASSHAEIVEGLPYREIVRRTQEGSFDLLVMGTHGVTGFERLLLGSVTEKVLHHVDIPLLVVSRSVPEAKATPQGARRFRTILLATDMGSQAAATLDYAISLARQYQAKLAVVHVLPPPGAFFGPLEAPWLASAELERQFEKMKEQRRQQVRALVPADAATACRPEYFIEEGTPEVAILDLAASQQADLIVLGAHGAGMGEMGWIGSTCHRVLRTAPCPVLAVRSKA